MESAELRRLVVRQRHVAPMLSALLAGTDAAVVITDLEGTVILERGPIGADGTGSTAGAVERFPILVERLPIGWVSGPRPAGAVAAVLSYACARETDKRALARVAAAEASGLPTGGTGFVLLRATDDPSRLVAIPGNGSAPIATAPATHGILGAILAGDPEIVNHVTGDPRATDEERAVASLVAAPLRVRGERIGVVGAASHGALVFTASDLNLLAAIAAIAAPTLDQAATHEAAIGGTDGVGVPG